MADIPTDFRLRSSLRRGAVSSRWLFILLGAVALVVFIWFLQRDSDHRGGMALEAYAQLKKSIQEHETIEIKDLTFHDDGIHDYRGDQYSGTFTRPGGEVVKVKAWAQWYSNAKGTGYLLNWVLETPAGASTSPASTKGDTERENRK
jgi:hypothetical protein